MFSFKFRSARPGRPGQTHLEFLKSIDMSHKSWCLMLEVCCMKVEYIEFVNSKRFCFFFYLKRVTCIISIIKYLKIALKRLNFQSRDSPSHLCRLHNISTCQSAIRFELPMSSKVDFRLQNDQRFINNSEL